MLVKRLVSGSFPKLRPTVVLGPVPASFGRRKGVTQMLEAVAECGVRHLEAARLDLSGYECLVDLD